MYLQSLFVIMKTPFLFIHKEIKCCLYISLYFGDYSMYYSLYLSCIQREFCKLIDCTSDSCCTRSVDLPRVRREARKQRRKGETNHRRGDRPETTNLRTKPLLVWYNMSLFIITNITFYHHKHHLVS